MQQEISSIEHQQRFDSASNQTTIVFAGLSTLYGELWSREYSKSPSEHFSAFCDGIDGEQINRIMRRAREKFEFGEKFPPSLGELIAWADIPTDGELFDIRTRIFARRPATEIEKWIIAKYLFNLRRMPEREVMKNIKSAYAQAVRLQRCGDLFFEESEILALPRNSEINLNDKIRENFKQEPKTRFSVMAKIDRMKRAQKKQPKVIS